MFSRYFVSVSISFEECFNVVVEQIIGVPRVLKRCFCPIGFRWVAAKKVNLFDKKHPETPLN